ncbi:hypothetical protein UA08_09181 [Talaromyces atroroseus]|uniref:Uncharacterized protein n=1 Tax=Talaromyces atroroseus TaxID=1441469 RepID=A0A1Q5Q731_TALAT|nr:hypothetical protein UA08_09181 [Talaromyces atroroseus]OKL55560.1 hypothetical protein UA08_09181 [Talaromyces atroroseus]
MKASICLFSTLLGMSSQAYASGTTATSTSGYLQIQNSSNSELDGYWGYIDPNIEADNGVVFQFISDKSQATNFSMEDGNLAGYKTGYVAGSTNAEGTASGDAIYMSDLELYVQGGEPVVTAEVNDNGVVVLSDSLGDGVVRSLPQACYITDVGYLDASLPVFVLGEEYFASDNCANITLYWRSIN